MRGLSVLGCLALTLTNRGARGDDDPAALEAKLKHLEEDVALVKELLKLRKSSSPSQQGASSPPTSAPTAKEPAPTAPQSPAASSPPAASPQEELYLPGNQRYSDLRSTVTFDAPGDRSRISIMSFKYNLEGEVSTYVERVFGSKALYYDESDSKGLSDKDFTDDEIKAAQDRFASAFKLEDKDKGLNPPCSVDMLGMWHAYHDPDTGDTEFVKSPGIKYKNEMTKELKGSNALGEATLHLSSLLTGPEGEKFGKEEWKCYYRDMWKLDNRGAAVYFYCPAPSKQHCDHLELMATKKPDPNDFGWGRVKADVSIKSLVVRSAPRVVWRMSFEAKIHWRGRDAERDNTKEFKRRAGMAVCTVIPYTTFDKEKARLNGVMIFEWVRYYLCMGYRVHVYDRDGSNAKYLFTKDMNGGWSQFLQPGEKGRTYHGGASTGNFEWNNLVYHNYTMMSVLDSATRGVLYDNTEGREGRGIPAEAKQGPNVMGAEERKWLTDRDKSLTFTQCRMEINAIWGIGDVFTGDFDEYLFSPEAPPTPPDQYQFMRSKINEEKDKGMLNMQLFQRVPTNATALFPRECMLKKLENGDASILECYGPYKAIVSAHSFKSFALGYNCPVQNYHQGYNTNRGFRIYECGDKNYLSLDSKISSLLHLTTHPKDFEKPCCGADKWTKEQIEEFRDYKKSELWKIVHWNQRRHLRE